MISIKKKPTANDQEIRKDIVLKDFINRLQRYDHNIAIVCHKSGGHIRQGEGGLVGQSPLFWLQSCGRLAGTGASRTLPTHFLEQRYFGVQIQRVLEVHREIRFRIAISVSGLQLTSMFSKGAFCQVNPFSQTEISSRFFLYSPDSLPDIKFSDR